uniref:Uncharacterized protein n=1 Tax=Manihot esculenta TaxID=3983 RepID=A0A2C9UDC5_MANES
MLFLLLLAFFLFVFVKKRTVSVGFGNLFVVYRNLVFLLQIITHTHA